MMYGLYFVYTISLYKYRINCAGDIRSVLLDVCGGGCQMQILFYLDVEANLPGHTVTFYHTLFLLVNNCV